MQVVVVGARVDGFAHLVLDHLEHHTPHEVVGFLDETPALAGTRVFDLPVFGGLDRVDAARAAGATGAFIAIGHGAARARMAPVLEAAGLALVSIVAPGAYVAPSARLGEGVFVGANAVVSSGTVVGDLTLVLSLSIVGHHARVGRASLLSGNVLLGGRARVGDRVLLGLGARVMADVEVGDDAVVGTGAVVTRDVPPAARVAGIPARPLGGQPAPFLGEHG